MADAEPPVADRGLSRRGMVAGLACLAVVLVIMAVFSWLSVYADRSSAKALHGVLDLRGVDLGKKMVRLDGDWELYWRRFITPEVFAARQPDVEGFVSVPESWRAVARDGRLLEAASYATLRLKILLAPQEKPLAIRLDCIHSAFKLWANGRLIAESGVPASNADEEVAEQKIQLAIVPGSEPEVDLVLHTSNFHPGGSIRTMHLGNADIVMNWQNTRWAAIYLVAGALMLMGIYHIALYLLRRANRPALYFGLYSLFWMVTILSIETDWAIRLFFPNLPAEFLFRTYRACMIAASALSYQFLRSLYPQEFPRWIQTLFWSVSAIYLALALLAPISIFLVLSPGYYPFSVGRMLYSIWGLSRASWRRREGALTILIGYAVFGLTGINDMLNEMDIIDTAFVMHFGLLLFMVSQALALATQFSHLFDSVQNLSETVVTKNRLLEQESSERIKAQQDIVALSEAVRARISHELHDGLCQYLTGARLLCSTLRRKWPPEGRKPDELIRLATILDTSVNHAYDLSHGLWPTKADSQNLRQTLSELIRKYRESNHHIPIALEFEGNCDECLCANTEHAHSIAREAIVNALKHAQPGRITVRLNCCDQTTATLTVCDDGIGCSFPRETPNRGGMGLRIMAYHSRMVGGDFRIEPQEGGGSRVVCTMPCLPVK